MKICNKNLELDVNITSCDHKAQQNELRRGPHEQHDLESQPVVQSRMFDGQRQYQTTQKHEVGRLQVVDAHLRLETNFILFRHLLLLGKTYSFENG
jgi:hypothetical protein